YIEGETPLIANCTFTRNHTTWLDQGWGGGILAGFNTTAQLVNCVLIGNTAQRGGGIGIAVVASPSIINCTIIGNTSISHDAQGGGVMCLANAPSIIQNTLLWDNAPNEVGGPLTISTSAVKNGAPGDGNTGADPHLVQTPSPG